MKKIIQNIIPPILVSFLKKIKGNKYGWKGNYSTWEEAKRDASGYDETKILTAARESLLKVKNGEAVYERDTVLFDEVQYSWPLLSGLMFTAIKNKEVRVLDFGGSLGSTYFQNKSFLDKIDNVSWSIVEQKHFVDIGKKEFEDNRLKFYYNVEECIEVVQPSTLLLSSVLQYIENPYELLGDILKNNFEYILIDRTPFNAKDNEQIKLQIVPPNIYDASYPCWFFNERKFFDFFENKGYQLVETFIANDLGGDTYSFKGMIWIKDVR